MKDQSIVNLSGYQFVSIDKNSLPIMREAILEKANSCQLKGTILLSTEGINAFVAGDRDSIDTFVSFLRTYPEFADLWFKESFSDYQPFNRMLVRLKKEIIPMGVDSVHPEQKTAPHLSPETLHQWYAEQKDMIVLDTRNAFEVQLGTFDKAMDLGLQKFRDFPEAIEYLPEDMKNKPIVTFCTGGIRCEKAAELMIQKGFSQVYQLEGGIINYFEKCGGDYYNGECFVFDHRVAIDSQLQETNAMQCFDCREALNAEQFAQGRCPTCGSSAISKQSVVNNDIECDHVNSQRS